MLEDMRTAVHEAGHAVAAIEHNMEVYKVTIEGDVGECRFRGRPTDPDWDKWVSLAGPAAERFFYGDPDDMLHEFGGSVDMQAVDGMDLLEWLDWDSKITSWVEENSEVIKMVAKSL